MFVYIRSAAFVIVVTQKLVLQQSKNVTAKCTETLLPPPCIQFSLSTTVCSQNINKQIVNIADKTLTDYSFLTRYHYTKSKKY